MTHLLTARTDRGRVLLLIPLRVFHYAFQELLCSETGLVGHSFSGTVEGILVGHLLRWTDHREQGSSLMRYVALDLTNQALRDGALSMAADE